MKRFRLSVYMFSFYLPLLIAGIIGTSLAQDIGLHRGVITVLSPKDHAVLGSGRGIEMHYIVRLSPRGDHLHIAVDGHAPIIDRDVSDCPCSVTLPPLAPGSHRVVIDEAMANHRLTGIESTVRFTVK